MFSLTNSGQSFHRDQSHVQDSLTPKHTHLSGFDVEFACELDFPRSIMSRERFIKTERVSVFELLASLHTGVDHY